MGNEISKTDNFFKRVIKHPATKSISASLICILIGILCGFVLMLISSIFIANSNPWLGLLKIFAGPFGNRFAALTNFGDMIFYTVPLIFCGLSVAISQKTGLFNIGAPGQFIAGSTVALLIALNIDTTGNRFLGVMVWILAVLAAIVAGALWGFIPGLFKALFGINEVIVCIMTNWIAAQICSWVFSPLTSIQSNVNASYLIRTSATGNYTPTLGLDKLFNGSLLDIGIFFAVIVAIALAIILDKTTFGYELKACGSNKNGAKYAGMNEKRNIILSMVIAGALAGLGAAFYYLNGKIELKWSSVYQSLPDYGFNGIPAALLAVNNPIGTIFSSLFIRYITAGGSSLSACGFNKYFADIIIAVIIYLAGFSRVFKDLLSKAEKKVKDLQERKARIGADNGGK